MWLALVLLFLSGFVLGLTSIHFRAIWHILETFFNYVLTAIFNKWEFWAVILLLLAAIHMTLERNNLGKP